MTLKQCSKCKLEKPVDEFHRRSQSKDGLRSKCKICVAIYHATPKARARKREMASTPDARAYARAYSARPENMARAREYRRTARKNKTLEFGRKIKWKFGISLEDYNRMMVDQNGVCAICHLPASIKNKRLAVDHCHETGKVRGLLCHACNVAVGLLKDDVERIIRAAAYIEGHKEADEGKAIVDAIRSERATPKAAAKPAFDPETQPL